MPAVEGDERGAAFLNGQEVILEPARGEVRPIPGENNAPDRRLTRDIGERLYQTGHDGVREPVLGDLVT